MGYKKIDDHVVIDEETGPIVKDVLTKFSEGGWMDLYANSQLRI